MTRHRGICLAVLLLSFGGPAAPAGAAHRQSYILAAGISWVQQDEDHGQRFSDGGRTQDILAILKNNGFN